MEEAFRRGIGTVGRIHLPRNYLGDRSLCDVTTMKLHGFYDASGKAYAAVVYLRVVFSDGFTTMQRWCT